MFGHKKRKKGLFVLARIKEISNYLIFGFYLWLKDDEMNK
jgi:hypothetical protein